MFIFVFFLFSIIFSVESNPIQSLKKCPVGTNDCIKNAAKQMFSMIMEPNANFGAEKMDPMYQPVIEALLGKIEYKLLNNTLKGYKTCELDKASYDGATDILELNLYCKFLELEGHYEVKGSLLSRPIEGNGEYKINTGKYNLIIVLNLETIERDENIYANIKSYNVKAEPSDNVHYHLTNLFGGDEKLGNNVMKFINENSKAVALIGQDPVLRANMDRVINNGNKYLNALPFE